MVKFIKCVVDVVESCCSDYVIWDDELFGFGFCVFILGKCSYVIQYCQGGWLWCYIIGLYGIWMLELVCQEVKV